jgi:imidazolonepropionase-like amidohydrolase
MLISVRRGGLNVHSGHSASATAFGTDILFDARLTTRQGAILAKAVRWYMPAEVLKMATADNGDLMGVSGFINPYPGKLGVVEQGAIADHVSFRLQADVSGFDCHPASCR